MWDLFLKLLHTIDKNYYENQSPELPIETHAQDTAADRNDSNAIGDYTLLRKDHQSIEGDKRWSNEWLLSEYVKNTDNLIGKMDGTIPLEQQVVYRQTETGLVKEKRDLPPPEALLLLDKSARPVEWLTKALWPKLARTPGTPYEKGDVPKQPKSYFINIDKKDWLRRMGVGEEDLEDSSDVVLDYDAITRDDLSRIRALYSTVPIEESNLDEAWDHPTIFDGQHVMIVDEVASSGRTLDIGQRLLSMAIPDADFSAQHWAKPTRIPQGNDRDGKMQFKVEWVPVWYSKDIKTGRGVDDKDPLWSDHVAARGDYVSRYARLGRNVMSTPPHDPVTYERRKDERANALRRDIQKLAHDLDNGRVFYRPSGERDDYKERIESINGMSFDEWRAKRDKMEPKSR